MTLEGNYFNGFTHAAIYASGQGSLQSLVTRLNHFQGSSSGLVANVYGLLEDSAFAGSGFVAGWQSYGGCLRESK